MWEFIMGEGVISTVYNTVNKDKQYTVTYLFDCNIYFNLLIIIQ